MSKSFYYFYYSDFIYENNTMYVFFLSYDIEKM